MVKPYSYHGEDPKAVISWPQLQSPASSAPKKDPVHPEGCCAKLLHSQE